jgi:hypothetical protein
MKLDAKKILLTVAAIICVLFIFRTVTMILEGEEGRLKRTIYKAKRFAERENIISLTNYISRDYYDELGNDRRSLLLIAKSFFDEYKNILIHIDTLEMTIEEKAAVQIEATVYWQEPSSENIFYDTAKVKAIFKKEQKDWKLIELKFFEPEKRKLFHPMVG